MMRIAVITGASSGIGREFARQIPRLYHSLDELWVVARRTDRLKELVKESEVPVRIFDGDMMRDYIFSRIEKELERYSADIRMLVNAAGYGKIGAAEELEMEEQCGMIDLNCRSLTKLTLLCLPYMTKGSRIINIASAAAFAPQPGFAVYAATKSYVYSCSQAIREETKGRGIVVTAVCPGPVDTEFFDRAGELKNFWKATVRADAPGVVRQALRDSVRRKPVSVYGAAMKGARVLAKIVPDAQIASAMAWMSKGSRESG